MDKKAIISHRWYVLLIQQYKLAGNAAIAIYRRRIVKKGDPAVKNVPETCRQGYNDAGSTGCLNTENDP
jgi:hypothetical protein